MQANNYTPKEREATWKLLLPFDEKLKLLLLTENEHVKNSLSRNYSNISEKFEEGKYYDAAIVDNIKNCDSLIKRILDSDIKWVIIKNYFGKKSLQRELNWEIISYYALLPPNNPRIIVSLKKTSSTLFGLNFHKAGSAKAKIKLTILKLLCRFGYLNLLKQNTVLLLNRENLLTGLQEYLSEKLKQKITEIVFYTGSDQIQRKITLLIRSEFGNKYVIKIADTLDGKNAVDNESYILRYLNKKDIFLKKHIPEILFTGEKNNYYFQIQTCSQQDRESEKVLTDRHLKLLNEFKKNNYHERRVGELITASPCKYCNDKVTEKIFTFLEKNSKLKLPVHLSHGDFAPWNIKNTKIGLFVYDWEDASLDGIAGVDIFHFIFRKSALIGPWPGNSEILENVKNMVLELYTVNGIQLNTLIAFYLLREYSLSKSDKVCELIEYFNKKI